MKVSDYVVHFVAGLGVKHVFVLTGGGAMHLNDSLARCRNLEFVCNHHEQACAIAAESYAKATNNIGVAMVTTGPGGTNTLTGVAGAWLDSTPCLFISGQVKRADRMFTANGSSLGLRQRGPQEIDIVSVVSPLTKYAATVTDPALLRFHLEKARYLALSGRPGPVWIDIPLDVQAMQIDENSLAGFTPEEPIWSQTSGLSHQVAEVITRLNRAERPLLLAGNGVRLAKAEKGFRQLVRSLGIPVETTWAAMDLLSHDDPLFVGRPGTLAPRGANFALQNCDFLLVIGSRMDLALSGWTPAHLARGAYKVFVDIDAAELAKFGNVIDAPICADAGVFIREMVAQSPAVLYQDRSPWRARCNDWKTRYPVVLQEHRQSEGPVSIYYLAEIISQEAGTEDQIVSGSSGTAVEIFLFAYPSKEGQRVIHTAGLGAMGFGLPASIGACLASGRRRTVCVDGDGGFQLNIQELATVAHLQLPIKFFILNNDGYAAIRGSQKSFFGEANIGCDRETGLTLPDVCKLAQAYGLATAAITDQADLRGQVRKVLDASGPVVCDVKVRIDEPRAPRVSSVQRPDGSFVSKPLEDLWPLLDREEFLANMIVPPLSE
jgi:acetolactate synthase-1/2/3 large subunit